MRQQTEEWFEARLGKVTASRVVDVMSEGRGGAPSIVREKYMVELLSERLTGKRAETFVTPAMEWGTTTEPQARYAYEFLTDNPVETVGFVPHPSIPESGASPDGLIGNVGLIEIKCPNTATHIKHMESGKIDRKYLHQIAWQLCCTQRLWCDFVSFDPRAPDALKIKITRVFKDEELAREMEKKVAAFIAELIERENRLRNSYSNLLPDLGNSLEYLKPIDGDQKREQISNGRDCTESTV